MTFQTKLTSTVFVALLSTSMVGCATGYGSNQLSVSSADAKGKTYYKFDKDIAKSGKSNCNGGCAITWPAAPASNENGNGYGSLTRKDGSKQLTFQGSPVYYYIGDAQAGQKNGDGVGGVWHLLSSKVAKESSDSYGSSYSY